MKRFRMIRDVEVEDGHFLMTTRQLSYLFKVSSNQVVKWKIKPCAKEGAASLYYLPEVLAFRYGTKGEKLDPSQEKAHLDNTRRQVVELQLEKLRGDLVEVGDVCKEVEKEYVTVRQRLLAIPPKLANQLVPLDSPSEIQDLLMDACAEALKDLTVERTLSPPEGPKEESPPPATPAQPGGVGGQVPAPL